MGDILKFGGRRPPGLFAAAVSLVTQAITTDAAGSIVVYEVELQDPSGIVDTGVITLPTISARWQVTIEINLGVVSGNNHVVEAWLESDFLDVGGDFTVLPVSGRIFSYSTSNAGKISYNLEFTTTGIGAALRLHLRNVGGSPELNSPTVSSGAQVPSAQMFLHQLA